MKFTPLLLLSTWIAIMTLVGCNKDNTAKKSKPRVETSPLAEVVNNKNLNQKTERKVEKRMPKQKFSKIVTTPAQPNPIGERLKKEFSGLEVKSEEFKSLTTKLWNENLEKISNKPLPSSKNHAVKIGSALPLELESWKTKKLEADSPENMIIGLWLMVLLSGDDVMINLIKQRSNILPPAEMDLVIYKSFSIAINEMQSGNTIFEFEKWETLSDAPNPLYRLLALKAVRFSTTQAAVGVSPEASEYYLLNTQPKLDFYLGYLEEQDQTIVAEALSSIATIPTPEARIAIEKYEAFQKQNGDTSAAQLAKDALRMHKLITERLQKDLQK